MKEKQVTYFEANYKGNLEQHYTENTADFENWVSVLSRFDKEMKVTYIAYDDGTTEGQAAGYQKL